MDLHDYKDVAENYDRYLEVMYATEDHYEGFQEFYLELAKRIRPLTMRQTYRQEMKWLVELCGFEIVDIYKDYVWNKAYEKAGNCIWVLKKK